MQFRLREQRRVVGRAQQVTTADRCSTGLPKCSRAGASSLSPKFDRAKGCRPGRPRARWIAQSTRGSGTPAGRTNTPRVAGQANPVAGPYFNLSVPEPTGVVVAWAPVEETGSSLLGLVQAVAPIVVSGNAVVVLAHPSQPLPAMSFAEVLHSSDVPGGVVNVLTGTREAMGPWLGEPPRCQCPRPDGCDRCRLGGARGRSRRDAHSG